MKNIKTFLVIVALLLSATVSGHDFCIDGICYSITSNEELIVQVSFQGSNYEEFKNEYSGTVVIPNKVTYNGKEYSVTSIGNDAFHGCSGLTSMTIPNSVTSIGPGAFFDCSGLTSVDIPNSVASIGSCAFLGCSGLTSVTIPNSVTNIGSWAFCNCSGLTSVTIGNSVTSIGIDVFHGCSGLTSMTIPNSVTSIGPGAFVDCSGLTSVTIPNSVTSIGEYAFSGCSGLTSVTIPNSVTSIGEHAFDGCSGLTSVTIPNSVTSIGDFAFSGCSGLTSVTIPSSVTSIEERAFSGCSGLTNVTIPNSVTSIGNDAFYGCTGALTVNCNIPSASNGGSGVFYGSKFTSVTIGGNVTEIGSSAFDGCSGLTSVTIPNSVTSIGNYAFYQCSGLTNLTIPNSVTNIGSSAFYDCKSLHCVFNESDLSITKGSTSNGYIAYYAKCVVKGKGEIIDDYVFRTNETDEHYLCGYLGTETVITLPEKYRGEDYGIDESAFSRNADLVSVTIPNSVTSIGNYAFYQCSGLTSVTIPNSVTSIGDYAFYDCSGLTSVTIPNSVTNIGSSAFDGCSGLTSVTVEHSTPLPVEYNTFALYQNGEPTTNNATLYVPYGSAAAYQSSEGWRTFTRIEEMPGAQFIIPETAAYPDEQFSLPVEMANTAELIAFQCDVYIPEGLTLLTDDKGRYDITLSSERCDDHTLSALLQSDGSIRIAMYSMSTSPILGTEGPLFTLNMSAGEKLSAYEVQIKNIYASDASGKLYSMADVTGTVTVDYRAGDANGDGMVAVNDVVYTVNKILNNAAEDFIFSAADMNDDNEIMINDVVMIVNTILGTSTTTAALAPRHMNAFETLSVADSRTAYGMTEFGITLSNAGRYTAMQFDMELAEGADIADIKMSMSTDHSVAYRRIDDTTVRVVVTSLSNEALAEGAQLCISMKDAAGKTVAFTNGRAACNNGQMVGIMPGSTVLGGTTGIDGINAEFALADVYSIDGKVVKKNATTLDGLKPGVYVVNGRKVVVEK